MFRGCLRRAAVVCLSLATAPTSLVGQPVTGSPGPVVLGVPWSPVGAVGLTLLRDPASSAETRIAERMADRALLAALREATEPLGAVISLTRDDAGRTFLATAATDDLEAVHQAMRNVVRVPLDTPHVESAKQAILDDTRFRLGSPRARFEALLQEHLGTGGAEPRDLGQVEAALARAGTRLVRVGLRDDVGMTWLTLRGGAPLDEGAGRGQERPPAPPAPGARAPARLAVDADVVTTWIGSVYDLHSGATIAHAQAVRYVLEAMIDQQRGPGLFERSVELDRAGRIVVRISTDPAAAAAWETRLDRIVATVAEPREAGVLRGPLRQARGRWSRALSTPAGTIQLAASALSRGATAEEARDLVRNDLFSLEDLTAGSRGMHLSARVVFGPGVG